MMLEQRPSLPDADGDGMVDGQTVTVSPGLVRDVAAYDALVRRLVTRLAEQYAEDGGEAPNAWHLSAIPVAWMPVTVAGMEVVLLGPCPDDQEPVAWIVNVAVWAE